MKEDNRDYLFDNIRAILIILVVWAHVLEDTISDYNETKLIYYFSYFFHMEAMIFISGYFSKNLDKSRDKAFTTILIPYMIFNILNYTFKMLVLGEEYYGFRLLQPTYGLWYLLALFLWKFFLKDLIKIRFILPLSFIVGILHGFSGEFSSYLALGRTISFLPFFLLGYYCSRENIEKIRKLPKVISFIIIAINIMVSVYIVNNDVFRETVFYFKKPYPEDKELSYVLYRIIIYIIASTMIIALINLSSRKKGILSKLGANTMTVYILHLFTIPILDKFNILEDKLYLYIIYSILATLLIVYLYSRPFVVKGYDWLMDRASRIILTRKA